MWVWGLAVRLWSGCWKPSDTQHHPHWCPRYYQVTLIVAGVGRFFPFLKRIFPHLIFLWGHLYLNMGLAFPVHRWPRNLSPFPIPPSNTMSKRVSFRFFLQPWTSQNVSLNPNAYAAIWTPSTPPDCPVVSSNWTFPVLSRWFPSGEIVMGHWPSVILFSINSVHLYPGVLNKSFGVILDPFCPLQPISCLSPNTHRDSLEIYLLIYPCPHHHQFSPGLSLRIVRTCTVWML